MKSVAGSVPKMSSSQKQEAEELDAAISAADERISQLWSDLRGLAKPTISTHISSESGTTALFMQGGVQSSSAGLCASDRGLTPEQGYENEDDTIVHVSEALGIPSGGGGTISERGGFVGDPQPQEPSVTWPAPCSPNNNTRLDICWQVRRCGGSETEVGTRIRANQTGYCRASVVGAPSVGTNSGDKCCSPVTSTTARFPLLQPWKTPSSDSLSFDDCAEGRRDLELVSTNQKNHLSLRRAIDHVLRGERSYTAHGHEISEGVLQSGGGMEQLLHRERRLTMKLKEGVAQLRAEQHRMAVNRVKARRSLEIKQRETEDEGRLQLEVLPVPASDVIFHRAVQTLVESRSVSTQTADSVDVYIDEVLLDRNVCTRRCGRENRSNTIVHDAPPWVKNTGISRRKHHDRVGTKSEHASADMSTKRLGTVFGENVYPCFLPVGTDDGHMVQISSRQSLSSRNVPSTAACGSTSLHLGQFFPIGGSNSTSDVLSRFEERCALALRRYVSSLDDRQRQVLMDDWGAGHGEFEGAELCIRIEVSNDTDQRFVPVQPQPLRQLRLCLGATTCNPNSSHAFHLNLGWIKVDYDENGYCQLPPLCACVMYRVRKRCEEGDVEKWRHFVHFSFRKLEHGRIFRKAFE